MIRFSYEPSPNKLGPFAFLPSPETDQNQTFILLSHNYSARILLTIFFEKANFYQLIVKNMYLSISTSKTTLLYARKRDIQHFQKNRQIHYSRNH